MLSFALYGEEKDACCEFEFEFELELNDPEGIGGAATGIGGVEEATCPRSDLLAFIWERNGSDRGGSA